MKKALKYLFVLLCINAGAQELNTVQKAMRDELDRSMKDLKSEGFEKPFFINYTLLDETSVQMTATLGALMSSLETKGRAALSIRLLVGDYEFNDESLDNNLFSPPQANEINLPLDDDYMGIRRSLWVSTDNVYRNASRQYARNKEMLKEQNKPLSDLPHRSFLKVAPSKIDIEAAEVKFDKTATEDYIRKVSAVFGEYRQIENSNVGFFYRSGYRYLMNSEGSVNRIPVSLVTLAIGAGFRTPEGEFIFDNIQHSYLTPELPPLDSIVAETKAMAEAMIASSTAPVFREEYTGPVMFVGQQTAQLFVSQLFMGEDNLIANNNIQNLKGFRYETSASMDTKIGKPVFAEVMTVKALPKMKMHGETTLLGSFEVDDEGVVPADETVLIENGVLKTLMNDRTMVKPGQAANGLGDGPGVVSITFKTTAPAVDLKAKLIAQAKAEGLEYALLVKGSTAMGGGRMMDVYKVYVADGREELVRLASMKDLSQRDFKKITRASKETAVYHVTRAGQVMSVICPEAVILDEVEFTGSNLPTLKEEEYVPSPLKK
jgi:predicted Zn-dependent protease